MQKALSRKGSNRMERRNEEQENDEASKKLIVKGMECLIFFLTNSEVVAMHMYLNI